MAAKQEVSVHGPFDPARWSGALSLSQTTKAALLAFVFLGLIWGSNFIFMKWAAEEITPVQIALLRVVFRFPASLSLCMPVSQSTLVAADMARWDAMAARSIVQRHRPGRPEPWASPSAHKTR
jgi:hypothetical protein